MSSHALPNSREMVLYCYIAMFSRMHLLETMPSSLPKLLNAVKWSQHRDVSVVSQCTQNTVQSTVR